MKAVVTGGCGFIGSHVADAYIEKGYKVVIIDNLSTGKETNKNKKARLYATDICSEEIREIFEKERPDVVNHHAAQISVPLSVREPLFDAEINIKGTIRLLEIARTYGVKKFIFASTGGAIYGDAEKVPTDETYVPEPASPYAISKFTSEKYIKFYNLQYRLPYTVLRYSNVYGPRQIPHGEAGVVAIFMEKLLAGEHPVLYHFPEEKRGMIRDYCYVKDITRANLIATESQKVGVFNVGTGVGTHTSALYRTLLGVLNDLGIAIPRDLSEPGRGIARPGDIKVSTLSTKLIKKVLHWEPLYDLKNGLRETAEWYLKHDH